MSIFSSIIDSLGQAVGGIGTAVGNLWNGAADFVSSGQQQEIAAKYSAVEDSISCLALYLQSLRLIQQELKGLGAQAGPVDAGAIATELAALETNIAEHVLAPQTLSNVAKIFPGGITFYLRGQELADENQVLDAAAQEVIAVRAQIAVLLAYYGRAYEVFFKGLLQAQGRASGTNLDSIKFQLLDVIGAYAAIPASEPGPTLKMRLDALNSQWQSSTVSLALATMQMKAAAIVAGNQAAVASRLRAMGINPELAA